MRVDEIGHAIRQNDLRPIQSLSRRKRVALMINVGTVPTIAATVAARHGAPPDVASRQTVASSAMSFPSQLAFVTVSFT
jgi:hypothetical protein